MLATWAPRAAPCVANHSHILANSRHAPVTVDRTEYHFLTTFNSSSRNVEFPEDYGMEYISPIIGRTIRPHSIVLNSLSFFIELNYDSKNQTGGSICVMCTTP
jgi:hypothetical protein